MKTGRKRDRIKFPKNTLVNINGIPFRLSDDTVLLGVAENIPLALHQNFSPSGVPGVPGVPIVLSPDQSETSNTKSRSSESINMEK